MLTISVCAGCGVPNLESAQCSEARDAVKEYYSLAIGGEPAKHENVLEKLRSMRSPNYSAGPVTDDDDPFYFSRLAPISSRVGKCSSPSADVAKLEVTVIWRINDKNSERTDNVSMVKKGDKWQIDRVDVGAQPGPDF